MVENNNASLIKKIILKILQIYKNLVNLTLFKSITNIYISYKKYCHHFIFIYISHIAFEISQVN